MNTHDIPHHGPYHNSVGRRPAPYWKRAHRSWIFWVGMVVTLAAIMIYVLSLDLTWRPPVRTTQPSPSSAAGR